MASPIGHALLGLAVSRGVEAPGGLPASGGRGAGRPSTLRSSPPWLLPALAALAAVAPDLDFLPGILLGDPNRFHQLRSHTLLAAALAGLAAGLGARALRVRAAVRIGSVVALGYASHLLLDVFTHDPRAPVGIPALWPLSTEFVHAPWSVFRGIRHGVPGQGLGTMLGELFSLHNLVAVGIEVGVTLPVLLGIHVLRRGPDTAGERPR